MEPTLCHGIIFSDGVIREQGTGKLSIREREDPMFHITTPEVAKVDTRNESAFAFRASGMPQSFTVVAHIDVSESIPESFLAGWADYQAGRVVDMERVLGDEPPPV